MAKCTGIRCPMQAGYKVDECDYKDCLWRTEPITNADEIRAMSDDELAKKLDYLLGCLDTGDCANMSEDCKACWLEWLQQPAE